MILRLLVLFSVVFLANGCGADESQTNEVPAHIREIDRIVIPLARQIAKEENLTISGSGGGMMLRVEEVGYWFDSDQKLTRDEARRLYIRIMERFLTAINEDVVVRPYLAEYPFTPGRMVVHMSFLGKDNRWHDHKEGIAGMSIVPRGILFTGYDSEKDDLYTIAVEPYEEALRIVREESP